MSEYKDDVDGHKDKKFLISDDGDLTIHDPDLALEVQAILDGPNKVNLGDIILYFAYLSNPSAVLFPQVKISLEEIAKQRIQMKAFSAIRKRV